MGAWCPFGFLFKPTTTPTTPKSPKNTPPQKTTTATENGKREKKKHKTTTMNPTPKTGNPRPLVPLVLNSGRGSRGPAGAGRAPGASKPLRGSWKGVLGSQQKGFLLVSPTSSSHQKIGLVQLTYILFSFGAWRVLEVLSKAGYHSRFLPPWKPKGELNTNKKGCPPP